MGLSGVGQKNHLRGSKKLLGQTGAYQKSKMLQNTFVNADDIRYDGRNFWGGGDKGHSPLNNFPLEEL